MKDRIYKFTAPYINPSQHGFSPGRSCLTYLSALFIDAIRISNNSQLDVLYFDLSKAFDSI